jgi:hypothetical protein
MRQDRIELLVEALRFWLQGCCLGEGGPQRLSRFEATITARLVLGNCVEGARGGWTGTPPGLYVYWQGTVVERTPRMFFCR